MLVCRPVRYKKNLAMIPFSFPKIVSGPQYVSTPLYVGHLQHFISQHPGVAPEVENTVYVSINRHSCAVDGLLTAESLGVKHRVAIFDAGDKAAGNAHVRYATESYQVAKYTDQESVLGTLTLLLEKYKGQRIIVDPGYGFLAENEDFVRALEALSAKNGNRLVFTGPTADAMASTSSKLSFRQLCALNGLPTIPGMNESVSLLGVREYFKHAESDSLTISFADTPIKLTIQRDQLDSDPLAVDKAIRTAEKAAIAHKKGERAEMVLSDPNYAGMDLDVLGLLYTHSTIQFRDADLRVKATEAGGGTGQRVVPLALIKDLTAAMGTGVGVKQAHDAVRKLIDQARIEGAGFGSSELIVEQNLAKGAFENLQHVELQVVADGKGGVIVLDGARNCSFQAGDSKKFLEYLFTFAPGLAKLKDLEPKIREMLAGYRGAGTLEFMYDPINNDFYLMEMNTRKQVEHKVTEDKARMSIPGIEDLIAMGCSLADLGLKPDGSFAPGSPLVLMHKESVDDPTVFCGQMRVNTETHAADPKGVFMPNSSQGYGVYEWVSLPKQLPQGVYVPGYCLETGQRPSQSGDTNIMRVLLKVTRSEVEARLHQQKKQESEIQAILKDPQQTEAVARVLWDEKITQFLSVFSLAGPTLNWVPLLNGSAMVAAGQNPSTLSTRLTVGLYSLDSIDPANPVRIHQTQVQHLSNYGHVLSDTRLKQSLPIQAVVPNQIPSAPFTATVAMPVGLPAQPSLLELVNQSPEHFTDVIRNAGFKPLDELTRTSIKTGYIIKNPKGERFVVMGATHKTASSDIRMYSLDSGSDSIRTLNVNYSLKGFEVSPPRPLLVGFTNLRDHFQSSIDNFPRLRDFDPSLEALAYFQNTFNEIAGGAVPARDMLTGVDTGRKFQDITDRVGTLTQCLFRGTGLGYENQQFNAMVLAYMEYIKAGCSMPRLFDACGILNPQQFDLMQAQLGLDGKTIQDFPNLRKSILALSEAIKQLDQQDPDRPKTMPILDVTYAGEVAAGDTTYSEAFYRKYVQTLIETAETGGLKPGSYVIGIKDMAGQGSLADMQMMVRIIRQEYAKHYGKNAQVLIQLHSHAPTDEADDIAAFSGADMVHLAFRKPGQSTSQPTVQGVMDRLDTTHSGQALFGDFKSPKVRTVVQAMTQFYTDLDKHYECMHVSEAAYSGLLGPLGCRFFRIPGGQSMTLVAAALKNEIPVSTSNDVRVLGFAYAFADMILADNNGMTNGDFTSAENQFKRLSLVTPTSQAANNLGIELADRLTKDLRRAPLTDLELQQAEAILTAGDISSIHPKAQEHGYAALFERLKSPDCPAEYRDSLKIEVAKIIRLRDLSTQMFTVLRSKDVDAIRDLRLVDKTVGDYLRGGMGISIAVGGLPSWHKEFMAAYALQYPAEAPFSIEAVKQRLLGMGISKQALESMHPLTLVLGAMLPQDNFSTLAGVVEKYGHVDLTLYQSLGLLKDGEESEIRVKNTDGSESIFVLKLLSRSELDEATMQKQVLVSIRPKESDQENVFCIPVPFTPFIPTGDAVKPLPVQFSGGVMNVQMKPMAIGESAANIRNLNAIASSHNGLTFGVALQRPAQGEELRVGTRCINKKDSEIAFTAKEFGGFEAAVLIPLRSELSELMRKSVNAEAFSQKEISATSMFLPTQAAFTLVSVPQFRAMVKAAGFEALLDGNEAAGFKLDADKQQVNACLDAIVSAVGVKNSKI